MPIDISTLVRNCMPTYFFDYKEEEQPANLTTFIKTKTAVTDNTVSALVRPSDDGETSYIHYFLFFMKDDGMTVLGMQNMGAHDYDIEQTIVHVDAKGAIIALHFLPHNTQEHFRITDANDIKQIVRDGHPQIYVSRGKHGCYPTAGTITRYLGFANDLCDRPARQAFTPVLLADDVANAKCIGNGFRGIRSRLKVDETIPRIRLSEVRLHNVLPVFR